MPPSDDDAMDVVTSTTVQEQQQQQQPPPTSEVYSSAPHEDQQQPTTSTATATAEEVVVDEEEGEPAPSSSFEASPPPPPPPPSSSSSAAKPGKADAEAYLNDVKRQFADQPHVYHHFVDLMKNFKSGLITTQNIIEKVAELFYGFPDLIDRFNQFSGYKPPQPLQQPSLDDLQQQQQQLLYQQQQQAQFAPYYQPQPLFAASAPSAAAAAAVTAPLQAMPQQQQQPQQQQALPQFDHAIHYVTRIKKRFLHDPDTYKLFLDILHTYQKESKSVNDVLSQVSELFRDHPDLLKDFTYFLPDGAQTQAKEEIQRLTAKRRRTDAKPAGYSASSSSTASKPSAAQVQQQTKAAAKRAEKAAAAAAASASSSTTPPRHSRREAAAAAAAADEYEGDDDAAAASAGLVDDGSMGNMSQYAAFHQQQFYYQQLLLQQQQQPLLSAASSSSGKPASQQDRGALNAVLQASNRLPRIEQDLFSKIKLALGTRSRWGEFLRCVELFSNETLQRSEFIALCVDLLQFAPELVNELDRALAARGVTEEMQEEGWFSVPLSEIDFTHCAHPTPSYHCLPSKYPKPMCSERTALCRQVLNDTHVAVAIDVDFGSRGRVNLYEDQLFKVEDDRFEMEMLIEANKSTTYALEQMLHDDGGNGACFQRFSTIHLKALSRMCGEEGTLDAFEALKKCPLQAIPALLDRLKTTLVEMELQKDKLQQVWAQMDQKNYAKSKDHRSSTFKRDDPKQQLSLRTFLLELKDSKHGGGGLELDFGAGGVLVHRHAWELVKFAAKRVLDAAEMKTLTRCFHVFCHRMFGITSLGGKEITANKQQQEVWCKLGRGELVGAGGKKQQVRLVPSGAMVDLATAGDLYEYVPFAHHQSSSAIGSSVILGRSGYFFLRYYHVLCDRVGQAMRVVPSSEPGTGVEQARFGDFLQLAGEYIAGQVEYGKYEDKIKAWMGKYFYMMMTLDKLLEETFKSFQHLLDEDKTGEVVHAAHKSSSSDNGSLVADVFRAAHDALAIKSPTGSASCVQVTAKGSMLHLDFPDSIPQGLTAKAYQVPLPVTVPADAEEGEEEEEEGVVMSLFTLETVTSAAAQELFQLHSSNDGGQVAADWWKAGGGGGKPSSSSAAATTTASTTTGAAMDVVVRPGSSENGSGASYSPLPGELSNNESEEEQSNQQLTLTVPVPPHLHDSSNSLLSPRVKRQLRSED